ncbi:MAG: Rossmann-like and DUF2520 domain-containing protein [Acidobacteriota bacterium]
MPPAGGNPAAPLSGLRVGILGPGRVGQSLGHWLLERGARLTLWGRRRAEGVAALERGGARFAILDRLAAALAASEEAPEDLYIVAVSDAALGGAARRLAEALRGAPESGPVAALHVSGPHDREILSPLRAAGVAIGSFHPLRAFADVSLRAEDAAGVTFAIDGDPPALAIARRLGECLGGDLVEVSGERRVLYHLAACLAAGGVATLMAAVDALREAAELPKELLSSYRHLTLGALEQLPTDGRPLASAITGPAARGDVSLLERQRVAVERAAPELRATLDALNELTARLRAEAAVDSAREFEP